MFGQVYLFLQRLQNKLANLAFREVVGKLGKNCSVAYPFYLRNPRYVEIGHGFLAGPGLRIEAWDSYHGNQYSPRIVLGDNVIFNWNVHIGAIQNIEIGDGVLVGSHVLITDHSHGHLSLADQHTPARLRPLVSAGPVIIENNVWIGEGVCIMGGVCIGTNAVVGANAVVTHDVPAGEIVGGVPARRIGDFLR